MTVMVVDGDDDGNDDECVRVMTMMAVDGDDDGDEGEGEREMKGVRRRLRGGCAEKTGTPLRMWGKIRSADVWVRRPGLPGRRIH